MAETAFRIQLARILSCLTVCYLRTRQTANEENDTSSTYRMRKKNAATKMGLQCLYFLPRIRGWVGVGRWAIRPLLSLSFFIIGQNWRTGASRIFAHEEQPRYTATYVIVVVRTHTERGRGGGERVLQSNVGISLSLRSEQEEEEALLREGRDTEQENVRNQLPPFFCWSHPP